ncbi:MAG: phage holin family protein [Actinobacteria bacterium]|nr:phage holin family protein [Actinomycetota bacterium]
MADDGVRPAESADKQLGDIVADVTQKAQLLVREEIELARAEIQQKVSRIVKGVIFFSVAGFFGLLFVIFLLHALSWGFVDWLAVKTWVGYGITTLGLLVFAGISALVGLRLFKRGTPPKPELAIEEAQKTRAVIEEARR